MLRSPGNGRALSKTRRLSVVLLKGGTISPSSAQTMGILTGEYVLNSKRTTMTLLPSDESYTPTPGSYNNGSQNRVRTEQRNSSSRSSRAVMGMTGGRNTNGGSSVKKKSITNFRQSFLPRSS